MEKMLDQTRQESWTVERQHTAAVVKSGGLEVLATPVLLTWMEQTAYELVQEYMEDGDTTVGTQVGLKHLAATPVGMEVRITARVVEVEGRKITFHIEAEDGKDAIATCQHQRFIVQEEKFMARCRSKNL